MQFTTLLLSAIVAGTTLVSASSPADVDMSLAKRHHDEVRALDAIYGRNNAHISRRHAAKGSKTCRAKSSKKNVKTSKKKTTTSKKNDTAAVPKKTTTDIKKRANKNGLCWSQGPWMDITPYKSASWLYSWKSLPGNSGEKDFVPDGMMFFPMLWSNGGDKIADWQKNVLNNRNSKANKDKIAMGPNEVNQDGQGKMTPGQACDLFRKYIMPLKYESGWQIIGPSTTSAPDGKTWMQNFKNSCPDVYNNIDYDSVHYYGTRPDNAINYLKDWHATFGKPMYITEIGCMNYDGTPDPSKDTVWNFMTQVMNFVNGQDYILGAAWYAPIPENQINVNKYNALTQANGAASDLWWHLTSLL